MTYVTPSDSFARPANTTAYASGDLVANSATAGSVAALQFQTGKSGAKGAIKRARLLASNDAPTNKTLRLHLWSEDPCATAPSNGDNGAIQVSGNAWPYYLGSIALDATTIDIHAAGNVAAGKPVVGEEIVFALPSGSSVIYGLLSATGAFTPGSAETFSVALEIKLAD